MDVRRGGQNGHFPPWKLGLRNKFLENMKSAAQFRLNWFNSYNGGLFVRHTLHKSWFTVLVSCSIELAVHLCYIAWPDLGADSPAVGLYCVTITWFTSNYNSRRFAAYCYLLLNADILVDNAARQWLLIAGRHVVLYCVWSQSESVAMQPQVWNNNC